MATEAKTQPTAQDPIAFLDRIEDPQRRADCHAVLEMMRKATGAPPVMWGAAIVGFGCYRYRYASGHSGEWPVIGFSPRKNDLTLYLMPGFETQGALMAKLGKHKTGKSCLYLKRLSDVDRPTLETLIANSVQAMASQRIDK
jgi:hypothetical protein